MLVVVLVLGLEGVGVPRMGHMGPMRLMGRVGSSRTVDSAVI